MPGPNDRMGRDGRPAAGDFSDPETGALTEEGMTLVRRAAGLGLTRGGVARLLGMHPDTFVDRRKKFPEIDEAYEYGKVEADLQVSNALFKKAKSGDMSAIRWYEMTRSDRNPNAPVLEVDPGSQSFVIEAPPKATLDDWVNDHSPTVIEHDPSPEAA